MGWKRCLLELGLVAVLLGPEQAFADAKQFTAPSIKGLRLDWCAHFGTDCGKAAADLFCRESGFVSASQFSIDQNAGARGISTLVFGDGRVCQGPTCSAFRAITCTKPDVAVKPLAPNVTIKPLKPTPQLTLPVRPTMPPPKGGVATTGKPPAGQASKGPIIAMPAGAWLYRCLKTDCEFTADYDFSIDPNSQSQFVDLNGDVSKVPGAGRFRWQLAMKPFPAFQSGNDLAPPALSASGNETGTSRRFGVDLRSIVAKRRGPPPESFYVRILPLATATSEVIVGQPSNVIRIYYAAKAPEQPAIAIHDFSPPKLFTVRVVSFTPPDFENPNRWGCIRILGYKMPLTGFYKIWADAYPIGGEACPASFKGDSSYQITSFGGFVDWLSGGVTDAVDWASDAYDELKQIAVDIVMKYTPFGAQCELIGELIDDDAPAYCEVAANIAVNAGLAALGLPPSIPNYNELIDEGVDHAVEIAAAKIFEETGYPCVGPCQDALRAGFGEAADQLKTTSYTPGCVGADEAHKHGREPLCLPDFIIAKPASGAIYTPPIAVVEVVRNYADKAADSTFSQACTFGVGIGFESFYPGGTEFGPGTSPKTITVPAQKIGGALYGGYGQDLSQSMAKGSRFTKTVIFDEPQKFMLSWTRQLWLHSQIPARDEQGPMGPDWFRLYSGSTAKVTVSSNCAEKNDTLTHKIPAF